MSTPARQEWAPFSARCSAFIRSTPGCSCARPLPAWRIPRIRPHEPSRRRLQSAARVERDLRPMPLLGRAAMLLSFDIVPEAMAEHDEWHTHEHLPERLSIPGFVRGTRWKALRGEPGYFVMYEV